MELQPARRQRVPVPSDRRQVVPQVPPDRLRSGGGPQDRRPQEPGGREPPTAPLEPSQGPDRNSSTRGKKSEAGAARPRLPCTTPVAASLRRPPAGGLILHTQTLSTVGAGIPGVGWEPLAEKATQVRTTGTAFRQPAARGGRRRRFACAPSGHPLDRARRTPPGRRREPSQDERQDVERRWSTRRIGAPHPRTRGGSGSAAGHPRPRPQGASTVTAWTPSCSTSGREQCGER